MAMVDALKCDFCGKRAVEMLEFPLVEKYLTGPSVVFCNDEERKAQIAKLEAHNASIEDMRSEISDQIRELQKRVGKLHNERTDNVRLINSVRHDITELDKIRTPRHEYEQLKTKIIANRASQAATSG